MLYRLSSIASAVVCEKPRLRSFGVLGLLAVALGVNPVKATYLTTHIAGFPIEGGSIVRGNDHFTYDEIRQLLSRSGLGYEVRSLADFANLKGYAQADGDPNHAVQYGSESGVSFTLGGLPEGTVVHAQVSMYYHFILTTQGGPGAFGPATSGQAALKTPGNLDFSRVGLEVYGNVDYSGAPADQRPGEHSGYLVQEMSLSVGSIGTVETAISGGTSGGISDYFNTGYISSITLPAGVTWQYDGAIPPGANPLNFQVPEPCSAMLFAAIVGLCFARPRRAT